MNPVSTPEQEYFEHLERFLGIIEPIIDDLKGKGLLVYDIFAF
ncbi:hypothetical protein ACFSOV_18570 [Pedobacter petrophilus]|nr:hypothetical protein [Pedobacter petrophilus]